MPEIMPLAPMLDSAFVLHRYSYQETSLLLKMFTRAHGLVSLIVKNVKKKQSDAYGILQCFQPLNIEYTLTKEVGTLKQFERVGIAPVLHNTELYSAFYLNELLLFLLPPHDAMPYIFDLYAQTLSQLEHHVELNLRLFELNLLKNLGFLPELTHDERAKPIMAEAHYWVTPGHLPKLLTQMQHSPLYVFRGEDLKNILAGCWSPETLKVAKRLCRIFIEQHTRGKTFKSRELFVAAQSMLA
jgi:DNA repair protein RecO (recombination protein O)